MCSSPYLYYACVQFDNYVLINFTSFLMIVITPLFFVLLFPQSLLNKCVRSFHLFLVLKGLQKLFVLEDLMLSISEAPQGYLPIPVSANRITLTVSPACLPILLRISALTGRNNLPFPMGINLQCLISMSSI
jgi:hypothetical protein